MDEKILKAICEPKRYMLLQLMADRGYCVRALARKSCLSEPAVSQHLKIMREAGLVYGVKRGYYTHYCLNREVLGGIIEELRAVKDEREIESIRRAQEIADTAYSQLLKMLTPNMTEADIACELEYIMRKNGAEDKSFDTIAVSGPSSSLPHGVPSNVKLRRGFLTMDFGAVVDGYHSDMTRTVCIGGADGDMKRLYGTVLTAQESALDFIRAGVKCSDCDRVARDIIDADYKGCFGHSLGHGVGLDIHESPTLSQKCDRLLTAGNVVTVEPGIYINGKYGCRIEDFVLVGENSAENFVKSPKELIEIL